MKVCTFPLVLVTAVSVVAGCSSEKAVAPVVEPDVAVMDIIPLPTRPEAIALGSGTTFFAGSSAASTDTTNHG